MSLAPRNPAFKVPDDPKTKIWRYLNFTKFVSMLQHSSLFFARSTELGDPFEGSRVRANEAFRRLQYGEFSLPVETINHLFLSQADFSNWNRQWIMVNSWCISEHESAAMWRLYGGTETSVCIQSTYEHLRACLDHAVRRGFADPVHVGEVRYIDYAREWMPDGNGFYPFLHKRRSFEHEREIRAIVWRLPVTDKGIDRSAKATDTGILVPVELSQLVDRVFVSPSSPEWFRALVVDVLKRYDLDVEVHQSSLDDEPFY